jgi:hypothetical protein
LLARILLAALCGLLSACTTPVVKYESADKTGVGYSDKKISDTQYAIQVYGYPKSPTSELADIFDRRAKELCGSKSFKQELGYDQLSAISDAMLYSNNGLPIFIPKTKSSSPYISGTVTCNN